MTSSTSPAATAEREIPAHLQLLEDAVIAVERDEVFQQFLASRAKFHRYSWNNVLLIATQRPDATLVAGYKAWQKDHNRQVRRGEKGIVILAPIVRRFTGEDPNTGEESSKRAVVGFRGARVFDVAQTDGEPLPPAPPRASLTGDSHAYAIPKLIDHAKSLGFDVVFEDLVGCEGYCAAGVKKIAVNKSAPANAQLRILIHELIHAHGTSYERFGRRLAETITDSATYVVCTALGLDVKQVVAEYVAGWSDAETRKAALGFIDFFAAEIERALGLHDRKPQVPANPEVEGGQAAA